MLGTLIMNEEHKIEFNSFRTKQCIQEENSWFRFLCIAISEESAIPAKQYGCDLQYNE